MCGIYGFFDFTQGARADSGILDQMGNPIAHRGPDGSGVWADGPVAFGHRRLKIIDLSDQASQPMSNHDKTVWITFNGEIYNYQEHLTSLKQKGYRFKSSSDTEVILHLYEEHGIGCLEYLNGMFAFAIWDKRKQEGFLVRDRLGIKPLHYTEVNNKVIFASEIKSLLAHPDISRAIDLKSLSQYLHFDYVPAPHTIFKCMKKLKPGHYIKISNGQTLDQSYWSSTYPENFKPRSESDYSEELLAILRRSVKRHLISDVPLGAFLSGGIDSSTVCALMRELGGASKIKTFHIGFEESSFDETRYAKQVSGYLGTDHRSEVLSITKARDLIPHISDFLDEPFADASFIPTLLLSRFARKHVTVSLSGDGGDELFAGYPTYQAHAVARQLRLLPRSLIGWLRDWAHRLPVSDDNLSFDYRLKKFMDGNLESSEITRHQHWLGSFDGVSGKSIFSKKIKEELGDFQPYRIAEDFYKTCPSRNWLNRILYCDQRFFLQDNMLVKIDRATMAASLEGRVPLLDREVVEFSARLPPNMKLKGLITKYILKKAVKRYLPKSIIHRSKKGFGIPLAKWFKADLKPFLLEIFEPGKIQKEGFFEPTAVSKLLNDHFEGKKDNRKPIYTLLNFELWYKKYAKGM